MPLPSNYLTATESIALVSSGKLTVSDIARDHLARYNERDGDVHAWAYVDRDLVLKEASRLDAIPVDSRGPLQGMLIGVKDIMSACFCQFLQRSS